MTRITQEQYDFLIRGIDEKRIGFTPQGMSHVEAWDDRRHLIRVFGFDGFDVETLALDLVREIEYGPGETTYANGKTNTRTVWTVVYRAQVRLIIKVDGQEICHFDDGAAGDSCNQPSLGAAHDQAMKTALSQALKRCCVNLGDQFGLSLYNKGQQKPSVHRSLVTPYGPPVIPPPPDAEQVQGPEDEYHTPVDDADPVAPGVPDATSQQPQALQAVAAAELEDPPAGEMEGYGQDQVTELRSQVSTTTSEEDLRNLYRTVADLLHAGSITRDQADTLAYVIRTRRAELVESGPPSAEVAVDRRAQRHMHVLLGKVGLGGSINRGRRLEVTSQIIGRTITTSSELTADEIRLVIEELTRSDPLFRGVA